MKQRLLQGMSVLLFGFTLLMLVWVWNWGPLEARLRERLQSTLGGLFKVVLHVEGLDYRVYPRPFIKLEGVHVGMPGSLASEFLVIDSLIAYPDLKGLFGGNLSFHSIWLNHPVLSLIRDQQGLRIKGTEAPPVSVNVHSGSTELSAPETSNQWLDLPGIVNIQGLNGIECELTLEDDIARQQHVLSPLTLYSAVKIREGVVTFEAVRLKARIHGDTVKKVPSKLLTFLEIPQLEVKPIRFEGRFRALSASDPEMLNESVLSVKSKPMKLEQFILAGDGSQPMWFKAKIRLEYRKQRGERHDQLQIHLDEGTLLPAFRPLTELKAMIELKQMDDTWQWYQRGTFKLNGVGITMDSEGTLFPISAYWNSKIKLMGLSGQTELAAQSDVDGTHLRLHAQGIDWQPLLKIAQPSQSPRIEGLIDHLDIDARAPRGKSVFKHLQGSVFLGMGKGAINDFNLPSAILKGYDSGLLERSGDHETRRVEDFLHTNRTLFKELRLSGHLKGTGLLLDQLEISDDNFHVDAAGEWVHQIPEQLHGQLTLESHNRTELEHLSPVIQKDKRRPGGFTFRLDPESGDFKRDK